jgi:hypothetical protein
LAFPPGPPCPPPAHALPWPRFTPWQGAAARALILLGEILQQAGDPAGALPYALSASLHCHQLHLASLAPGAALLVASLWHALAPAPGGAAAALGLLRGALPLALARRDGEAVGRLQVAIAEVLLGELQGVGPAAASTCALGAGSAPAPSGNAIEAGALGGAGQPSAAEEAAGRLAAGAAALEAAGSWRLARRAWALLAVLRQARGEEVGRDAAARHALACERGAWGAAAAAGLPPGGESAEVC